jgi:hypothetical protein
MPHEREPLSASARADEYARMLAEANRQPGVADVVAVYQTWRDLDATVQRVTAASTPTPTVLASDSSIPPR